jgi:hypothetical protein
LRTDNGKENGREPSLTKTKDIIDTNTMDMVNAVNLGPLDGLWRQTLRLTTAPVLEFPFDSGLNISFDAGAL